MKRSLPFLLVSLVACSGNDATAPSVDAPAFAANAITTKVTGGGITLSGMHFNVNAQQREDGSAKGQFKHYWEVGGFVYDFVSEVVCVVHDPVLQRAWIGGTIVSNATTDPAFQQAIHQPGFPIWFRVADRGEGQDAVDRITFVGFKGTLGIQTSPEYCQVKPWGNEGQGVGSGNIQVH